MPSAVYRVSRRPSSSLANRDDGALRTAKPDIAGISMYGPRKSRAGTTTTTAGMVMYFALGRMDRRSRPTKRAMARMSVLLVVGPLVVDHDLLDRRGLQLDAWAERGGVSGSDDAVEAALAAAEASDQRGVLRGEVLQRPPGVGEALDEFVERARVDDLAVVDEHEVVGEVLQVAGDVCGEQ